MSVLEKVCHFSVIFSLFEAICTHILIGGRRDSVQRICFECEKLLGSIYRTK